MQLLRFALGFLFVSQLSAQPLYHFVAPDNLYSVLPRNISRIHMSDQQVRGGASSRIFLFSNSNVPMFLSLRQADIDDRGLVSSQLPLGFNIGENSLFYIKDDESLQMVFTDNTRRVIYYAGIAGGYPVISSYTCTGFSKISDIHIVELNGVFQKLIVADEGANRVYSYDINTNNPSLCVNGVNRTITGPKWLRSPNVTAGDTSVFVGSQDRFALQLTRLRATDLDVQTATETLSNVRGNSFGEPFVDPQTGDLFFGIRNTKDSENGDDHVWHYEDDFSDSSSFKTCRSPDQILQDFENGADRFRYVFCENSKQVYLYNNDDERVAILSAGSKPLKLFVGSDGDDRFLAILQKDKRLQLHRIPADAELIPSETVSLNLELPILAVGAGKFGALDELVLVGDKENEILFVDLIAQTLRDRIRLPQAVDDIAVEDEDVVHLISKNANSAYTWEELSSGLWSLITYDVGTKPIQIERRANRAYVLNQSSENLSIINTTSGLVSNLATGGGPVAFDFNTVLDELWVANREDETFSVYDISVGAEALDSVELLNIAPEKIAYQSSDATIYFSGEQSIEAIAQNNFGSVKVTNLNVNIHGLRAGNNGVFAFSRDAFTGFYENRTTSTEIDLDYAPHFMAAGSGLAVFGILNPSQLHLSNGNTFSTQRFSRLFSGGAYFAAWEEALNQLRLFPFGLVNADTLPSFVADLAIRPDLVEVDTANNFWIADSTRRVFQRISSGLQPDRIRNKRRNDPVDIIGSSADERLYTILKNANLLAVTDLDAGSTSAYVTCNGPAQLALADLALYVLCPQSKMLGIYTLNAAGDIIAQNFLATDEDPESMLLHPDEELLFVLHPTTSRLGIYDLTGPSLDELIDLPAGPRDMSLDVANDELYIVSESSRIISSIDLSDYTVTSISTGYRALDRIVYGDAEFHAVSRSLNSIFHETTNFSSGVDLTRRSWPFEMAYSPDQNKIYLSYPLVGAVKVMDEDDEDDTDIDVGARVKEILVDDENDIIYLAAPEDSEIIALNAATDAIAWRVDMPTDCRPGKMQMLTLSGQDYLYVACRGNDEIQIIDLSDNSLGNPLLMRLPEL